MQKSSAGKWTSMCNTEMFKRRCKNNEKKTHFFIDVN